MIRRIPILLSAALASVLFSPAATAQDCDAIRSARSTLYNTPLTIDAKDARLADVIEWFTVSTRIPVLVAWQGDDGFEDGIDPETLVTLKAKEQPALSVLEAALRSATRRSFLGEEFTWQISASGDLQIGPKSILNRSRRVEIYELADLLIVPTNHDNAPELDLNQALQASQGGGGGQAPFTETGDNDTETPPLTDRLQDLVDLITSLVEPEQWETNGGDGASIRPWRTSVLVNAPEYVHRQLGQGFCSVGF